MCQKINELFTIEYPVTKMSSLDESLLIFFLVFLFLFLAQDYTKSGKGCMNMSVFDLHANSLDTPIFAKQRNEIPTVSKKDKEGSLHPWLIYNASHVALQDIWLR
ncbi:hypothetical protein J3Q64DRAFT_1704229 [Phycomyces blakesleeanus]|uniref:Uncharacterized protein n=2 Tax=Phycomyces blakesleeanus TaxID=4837 RepID=A0A162N6P2_PHYB8|nr:hypothetical protein PHYBLDRAFT_175327 [Phycomyces blakesleeanus NRRL 1555(-)]OAD66274.1 hypothetical protein PHYBLDRAFT_175327 [Phycomyces blakesleeanus NRRL 1555(-)]|eukprot:XP_018284314.1 hypothetical protein PHYBLDRAFT_175327 [Phycomyces blakesleeanus NRRL 1555(-)]